MRRKDREVTDIKRIEEIIHNCNCCRVGFYDDGEVYIVPLSFGYTVTNGSYTLYFHGAGEGRKIELAQKNLQVGFEMDANYQLKENEVPCDFSVRFQSIIGNGRISVVENPEEIREGLLTIMNHYAEGQNWKFNEQMLKAVKVLKLQVSALTCKEHA